jgi:hypothetical protein
MAAGGHIAALGEPQHLEGALRAHKRDGGRRLGFARSCLPATSARVRSVGRAPARRGWSSFGRGGSCDAEFSAFARGSGSFGRIRPLGATDRGRAWQAAQAQHRRAGRGSRVRVRRPSREPVGFVRARRRGSARIAASLGFVWILIAHGGWGRDLVGRGAGAALLQLEPPSGARTSVPNSVLERVSRRALSSAVLGPRDFAPFLRPASARALLTRAGRAGRLPGRVGRRQTGWGMGPQPLSVRRRGSNPAPTG